MPKPACAIRPSLIRVLLFGLELARHPEYQFDREKRYGCWLATLSKIVPPPVRDFAPLCVDAVGEVSDH
jgi:hypothetical protein